MKPISLLCALSNLVCLGAYLHGAQPDADPRIEFNRDVRPILSDNCFYCHGPDQSHRKAKLRLDIREEALKKEAFVPGKPAESELIKRLTASDPDELMPPADSHKKLTEQQKSVLRRWIVQGAEYQLHWSYEPIVKSKIPADTNGVDFLVRNRLSKVGLKPSPLADRRTLIRRLYWDLVGFSPTPQDVHEFLNDTAPEAYERLVERLLANPHYGEKMALYWLDVVRFADTIGYHSDNPRNVWPYRDWVIRAFNENKRFDRFTIEQIAGDLLPDADDSTRVGSAFNRLLLTTQEGGAQAKDYEARMMTDRVRAIGAAWLGQTTGCAQCHDHKFDPFTTRDFYEMGAFFADVKESIVGQREDGMLVIGAEEKAHLAKLDTALEEAKKGVKAVEAELEIAQKKWEAALNLDTFSPVAKGTEDQDDGAEKKRSKELIAGLKKATGKRNKAERTIIEEYFREHAAELHTQEWKVLKAANQARNDYYAQLPKCLVSSSTAAKRTVRILPRGNWMDETGDVVKPRIPGYLPQPNVEGRELNRLDLAEWLVSKENPLTARTVMNRLWKQFFGTGLSKVLDDLGAQGELPPNGPLLDWLAAEFRDNGWDLKQMVRLIVLSQTYKQVSAGTPELLAADPYNRELARQSPFRVDAEFVRDNALVVAGLLVPTIGGPSVKPYQPERYWENLNFPTRDYFADKGDSQYRRGLYTWWQRSFLHPGLLAFDAPSREECCAERTRSNIPQQALALLNDPTYVEAARVLAQHVLSECSGAMTDRIQWAWNRALQRDATEHEIKTMVEMLERHLADYRKDPKSAAEVLQTGLAPLGTDINRAELAAWTHVARVLLNLHETITRS